METIELFAFQHFGTMLSINRSDKIYFNCAFTANATGRHNNANQKKFIARKTCDKILLVVRHFALSRASVFTWICSVTLSMELKYLNFDTPFA